LLDARHRYGVYGVTVVSDTPLALPEYSGCGLAHVECQRGAASVFRDATQDATFDHPADSWYRFARLADASTYVRWDSVGEFLVGADGGRITCRRFDHASPEAFQVYMLGQALSFALVKQRLEPLHATAVVVHDRAVAFLGTNGSGKSTLAASFLDAGCRLLTDDLLVLHQAHDRVLAYPGPARIKLFSKIARAFLADRVAGAAPMNADTEKLILALDGDQSCPTPVRLAAVYALAAPREVCRNDNVHIEPLSRRQAFVELVRGSFNRRLVSPDRIERQFRSMAALTDAVPVKTLAYPRAIDRLPEVRKAVLADFLK
jgi:hypothetical protein